MTKLQIKNGGKVTPVDVDLLGSHDALREAISKKTGIPPTRMKVMTRSGILNVSSSYQGLLIVVQNNMPLSNQGWHDGSVVVVVGTAERLPLAPVVATTYGEEDLDESGSALQANQTSAGLINLGQTCYLNSSLQVLRSIDPLRDALAFYTPSGQTPEVLLTSQLRDLFASMKTTSDPVSPILLLSCLRLLNPQFAERDNRGNFAQQDADEVWNQMISALGRCLDPTASGMGMVEDLIGIDLSHTLTCNEAPQEPPTVSSERLLQLSCNISISTNFLMSGIQDNLNQTVEKTSQTLGRAAVYQQKSRVSRLPAFLSVHMVRFYWRRDIRKKAKIMRKVKFPLQLDLLDIVTDELRTQLGPVNSATKQILKEREDRARIAKRNRGQSTPADTGETARRADEKARVDSIVAAQGLDLSQIGPNPSGMYELYGLVTHKGPGADSGHYIGWTRKDDDKSAPVPSEDQMWYCFDDDKVSIVNTDRILKLDGGGEDSVAYILLYRAIPM